jgi:hypothetical protein
MTKKTDSKTTTRSDASDDKLALRKSALKSLTVSSGVRTGRGNCYPCATYVYTCSPSS